MPRQEKTNIREPIGLNVALGVASFMTAYDRTKTIKGGLAGAAIAGSFILARRFLSPKDEYKRGITNTLWGTAQFSAITSLLGSSMMRGGFLYKSVGKPIQRAIVTKGWRAGVQHAPRMAQGLTSGTASQAWQDARGGKVGKAFSYLKAARMHARSLSATATSIDDPLWERITSAPSIPHALRIARRSKVELAKKAQGAISGSVGGFWGKKIDQAGPAGVSRIFNRYYGIAESYLGNVATGGRGPFEATSGIWDLGERLLQMVSNPKAEITGLVRAFQGPRWGVTARPIVSALTTAGEFSIRKASGGAEGISTYLNKLYSHKGYKVFKGSVKSRKFFEGVFGSPTVGEAVQKYGSIKNIPLGEYASANIKDVLYGATPGMAIGVGIIGIQTAVHGVRKGYNKIVGHHPGRMNKVTEAVIDSDFTAGQSLTGTKNAFNEFSGNNSAPIKLYRWGPPLAPRKDFILGADKIARDWLSTGETFYAAGSQEVAEAWALKPMGFGKRDLYEVTLKRNPQMLLHSSHGFPSTVEKMNLNRGASHIIRNTADLKYKPWVLSRMSPEVSVLDPEGAQVIGRLKDVISTKKIDPKYLKDANFQESLIMPSSSDSVIVKSYKQQFRKNVLAGTRIEAKSSGFIGKTAAIDRAARRKMYALGISKLTAYIAATALAGMTIGKIVGHHPGWANKQTEGAIDSDFTAGASWTKSISKAYKYLTLASRKKAVIHRGFERVMRKSFGSTKDFSRFLGATELSEKGATEISKEMAKSVKSALQKMPEYKALSVSGKINEMKTVEPLMDTMVAGFTVPPKGALMGGMAGAVKSGVLRPGGIYYNQKRLVKLLSDSNLGMPMPSSVTKSVPNFVLSHEGFEKVVQRVDGMSKSFATHSSIDVLHAEAYLLGRTEQRAMFDVLRPIRINDFKMALGVSESGIFMSDKAGVAFKRYEKSFAKGRLDNIRAIRAQKNLSKAYRNKTVGLTNNLLHGKRTQHQVMDVTEKTKHLFNI